MPRGSRSSWGKDLSELQGDAQSDLSVNRTIQHGAQDTLESVTQAFSGPMPMFPRVPRPVGRAACEQLHVCRMRPDTSHTMSNGST